MFTSSTLLRVEAAFIHFSSKIKNIERHFLTKNIRDLEITWNAISSRIWLKVSNI